MKNLKKIISNNENKRLIENFFSLSILNVINYIFPLILTPYLTRILGVNNYGSYVFAYAIINYFVLIVRYGFDLSATKQVALKKNNNEQLNNLFVSVLYGRIILSIISIFLIIVLISTIPKLSHDKLSYIYGIGIIIGIAITPTWFFQGMENMKFITIINFLIRLSSTILILIFIKNSSDYNLVLLFHSIGFLAGGLFSLFFAFKFFKIKFKIPRIKQVIEQMKDGWYVFLSTVGMNFYRESNIIILGFLTNYHIVGYYAAAEKLVKLIQSFNVPFVNTLYPYFGRKLNQNNSLNEFTKYNKIGFYYIIILIIITLIAFFCANLIVKYLGEQYTDSIIDFRILSLVIIFGGFNYYFGVLGLVNIGKEKYFSRYVWISGIVCIILCITLSHILKDIGAAIAMVAAEFLLTIMIFVSLNKITNKYEKTRNNNITI